VTSAGNSPRADSGSYQLVPHDVRNIGEETVRVVGFFSNGIVVSVFDDPLIPDGKRVVGTPLPEESEVVPATVSA
jgi:hypothetical protein